MENDKENLNEVYFPENLEGMPEAHLRVSEFELMPNRSRQTYNSRINFADGTKFDFFYNIDRYVEDASYASHESLITAYNQNGDEIGKLLHELRSIDDEKITISTNNPDAITSIYDHLRGLATMNLPTTHLVYKRHMFNTPQSKEAFEYLEECTEIATS